MKGPHLVFSILFLLSVFLVGCDAVSDKQALREFKKAYPNAVVYEQFVGEGDSDDAYMHFRFTIKGSDKKKEVVWLYQRQEDGTWKATYKSEPKTAGSYSE